MSIISENRITVVPKSIPFETCALLGCSLTTALGLVNNEAKIKIGQSVLIFGSGSVGLSLAQACKMVTAYPIGIVDIKEKKLKFSKQFGVSHTIKYEKINFKEKINKIYGSKGPEVIIDTVGSPELLNKAYSILSSNGKLIMVGQPKNKESIVFENASENFSGKIIFDSQGGLTNPDEDIKRYIRIFDNAKSDINKLITNVIEINNINLAINDIRDGKNLGKTIIKF